MICRFVECGSSPHVRGTRVERGDRLKVRRLIPACAGNTRVRGKPSYCLTAHPRVCGEHSRYTTPVFRLVGSSPRVRGTPRFSFQGRLWRRLIPACAGNTGYPNGVGWPSGGSSPRVRGTLMVEDIDGGEPGLIPACAGNTSASVRHRYVRWAHPRVCGEHVGVPFFPTFLLGSSPRVRGTLPGQVRSERAERLIPACAGNTGI
ncbi:Domain of uncharacterised function (DUF2825) [Corynebacterium renale]|nr:Domain of uncharacterised function (DUF2825) [Corynebacterium renale]